MMVPEAKAALRREIRARMKNLTAAERATSTDQICQRVLSQNFWKSAKTMLLFAPLPDEPDIWPLAAAALAAGKTLALPRLNAPSTRYTAALVTDLERDLVTGAFGIREPAPHCLEIPLATIAVALIPGLAFDPAGRRLGRGKGFYDRLLCEFGGHKCGVALDVQIVAEIPTERHDVSMNMIVTETRAFYRKND